MDKNCRPAADGKKNELAEVPTAQINLGQRQSSHSEDGASEGTKRSVAFLGDRFAEEGRRFTSPARVVSVEGIRGAPPGSDPARPNASASAANSLEDP